MLLTDRFVYIHQPKTGGTFVADVLRRIHEARGERIETLHVSDDEAARVPARPGGVLRLMLHTRHQHGTRSHIPAGYRDRPVLATVRSPYDRYVSQFEFAWWRTYPEMFGPPADVRRRYPRFPDLSLADFIELTNTVSLPYRRAVAPDETPGFHTQQFVEYFARVPAGSYDALHDDDEGLRMLAREAEGLRVLDQARLNEALHAALIESGYGAGEVDFVRTAARVLPPEGGRAVDDGWTGYYSSALKQTVRHRERLLFQMFPHYDV